ncbi:hypothetical protein EPA93_46165 [Ktedonosporobacter rubrisoli]|uniref:Uncharacterized protein n=1 Tax=Ktedonosporobacter rubrisoli TaxID=2509675 RepID=A0A4P6K541_KTERU|nr:hypothetical protein [Ktedonosporobacter rubrisoli]QBD82960.1 hypothetical protein EPA93_46165 [Ktedonosporobacter rubrisoli]
MQERAAVIAFEDRLVIVHVLRLYKLGVLTHDLPTTNIDYTLALIESALLSIQKPDTVSTSLTDDEVRIVDIAFTALLVSIRVAIPPSQERDEMLAGYEQIRSKIRNAFPITPTDKQEEEKKE